MRALLLAAALVCAPALAHAVADEQAARRDCASDALTYCASEISQGRSAIVRCMKRNRAKLSPRCRTHFP